MYYNKVDLLLHVLQQSMTLVIYSTFAQNIVGQVNQW